MMTTCSLFWVLSDGICHVTVTGNSLQYFQLKYVFLIILAHFHFTFEAFDF